MVKLTKMYVILRLYDVVGAVWSLLGSMVPLETWDMDQSLTGQWLCWSRLRKGLTLHERLSVRMEIKRLLIRWGVMIIKYIIINLMIGTMADYVPFWPLQMWVH